VSEPTDPPPRRFSDAVSAALDELLGPDPVEVVEEQPPATGLPDVSGASEEHERTFPTLYGG
jgi:hypothetical protein